MCDGLPQIPDRLRRVSVEEEGAAEMFATGENVVEGRQEFISSFIHHLREMQHQELCQLPPQKCLQITLSSQLATSQTKERKQKHTMFLHIS